MQLEPARFWSTVRCHECGAPVDPTRLRRLLSALPQFLWTRQRRGAGRLTHAAAWAYLFLVLITWLLLFTLGDRWWLLTGLVFGPRWVLLVPLLVIGLGAIAVQRSAVWPALIALFVVVGPVMGFRTGWKAALARWQFDTELRVVTFNMDGERGLSPDELPIILSWEPDVIVLQECIGKFVNAIEGLAGWTIHREGGLCLFSRHRIESIALMTGQDRLSRSAARAVHYRIQTPIGPVSLVNAHLDSPRGGLRLLMRGAIEAGSDLQRRKIAVRDAGSRLTREWIDSKNAEGLIVVGDLNMPVESAIYRRDWSDLDNAFSQAGWGFGITRHFGGVFVRIDHALLGPGWRPLRARVGPSLGSDHRPVIVDLARVDAP